MSTVVIVGAAPLAFPGGVESVCREAIEAVAHRGHRVGYVSMSEIVSSSRLASLPARRHWQGVAESVLSRRFRNADVVVTNGPLGVGLRGKAGSLHLFHGTYAGQAEAVRSHIRPRGYLKMRYVDGPLLEGLAGRGKICVANSMRTANEVAKYYGLESEVIWVPVDTERFKTVEAATVETARHKDRDGGPTVLFVGAGRPAKGDGLARSLVRRLSDVRWLVVGDDFPLAKNVTFRKTVARVDMPDLLRSVDLVLTPSLYDSFGLLGAEAILSGTPIATSPTGLGQLMQGHERLRDWVFLDPEDDDEAAAVVDRVLRDERACSTAREARGWLASYVDKAAWSKRFLRALERAESQH